MRKKHLLPPPNRGRAWNGERAVRAEAVLLDENRRLGRGISYDELTGAYQARHGELWRSGSAMLEAGIWRGTVLVDELSTRTVRVRHVDADVPFWFEHDLPVALRRHMLEWFAREQCPISSRRMTAILQDAGVVLPYRGAIPALLDGLTTGAVARVQPGKHFTCLQVGLTLDRFDKRFRGYLPNVPEAVAWLEDCLATPITDVSVSFPLTRLLWPQDAREAERLDPLIQLLPKATAARVAVARVQAHFGEPVEVSRLRLWIAEHPARDTAWRDLTKDTIRDAVAESARRDAEAKAEGQTASDHCHVFEHSLTGWGRCAPRYHVGPLARDDAGVVLVEDVADYFRLADEAKGQQTLAQQPWLRRDLRTQLLTVRQAAVAAAIQRHIPSSHRDSLGRLAQIAADRVGAVAAQYQAAGGFGTSLYHYITETRQTLQHVQAFSTFLPVSSAPSTLRLVGEVAASVDLDDLRPIIETGVAMRGLRDARGNNLMRDARRTPALDVPGRHPAHAYPRIDRADAIAEIISYLPLTRANALINSAMLILGAVLRDATVLRDLLAALGPADHAARRVVILALGLLGESVDWDAAAVAENDPLSAASWVLATVAAGLRTEVALPLVQHAARRAKGAARHVLTEAVIQLRAGRPLNVIG